MIHCAFANRRGGDVQEDDLVGSAAVVLFREMHGVPGIPEFLKLNALDDASFRHVEAGNYFNHLGHGGPPWGLLPRASSEVISGRFGS